MKLVKIAAATITAAIVSMAFYSARAEVAGKTISAQAGFSCPQMETGVTTAQRDEIHGLLRSGTVLDDPARLNASIDGLKHLGLSKTMIIDHLIGAYCATVAHDGSLSDGEKTATVRRFASRITPVVYDEEDVSAISLNVLLRPSVADKVAADAQASGLSVEKWLSKTIEAAVK